MGVLRKNLIAGEWLAGEREIENRNPSDLSELAGIFAQAGRAQRDWAGDGAERRRALLMATGTELMSRAGELGPLLSDHPRGAVQPGDGRGRQHRPPPGGKPRG